MSFVPKGQIVLKLECPVLTEKFLPISDLMTQDSAVSKKTTTPASDHFHGHFLGLMGTATATAAATLAKQMTTAAFMSTFF